MAFTAERKYLFNALRVGVAAMSLSTASGAFESPKFFGRNSDRVYAAELHLPEEQVLNDLSPVAARAMAKYPKTFENRDVSAISRGVFDQGQSTRFYWKVQGEPARSFRSGDEMSRLFSASFAKAAPECVGYTIGRELRVVFKNLSALGSPELSGYSEVGFRFSPLFVEFVLGNVEEIPRKDLQKVLAQLRPCKDYFSVPSKPQPKKEANFPPALAKAKVVYIGGKDGGEDLYVSNLDGMDEKRLTNDGRAKRDPKWINPKEVVYASLGKMGQTGEAGIVKINVETGHEEYLTQPNTAIGEADYCPSPDSSGGVVFFHRQEIDQATGRMARSFRNTYSVDSKTKKIERITSDTAESAEDCPTPSPDGKQTAIATHIFGRHGLPGGIAVYKSGELKNFDPNKLPGLIKGGKPLFWSPDSKWLYFVGTEGENYNLLFRTEVSSGKVEILLIDVRRGASISPDGNWIITPISGENFSTVIALRPNEAVPTYQMFERDFSINGFAIQPKNPLPERNMIVLFPGLGSIIENGRYKSGLFDDAIGYFIDEMGYRENEVLLASLGGWTFNARGDYVPKDQECDKLLWNQDANSQYVIQLLLDLQKRKPNDRIIMVTHSLGATRVLRALQRIKDEKIDIEVSRLKVVLTNGPNIGVDTLNIENLVALYMTGNLDKDCNISIGSIDLPIPIPGQLNFPALVELKEMWDNRKERRKQLQEVSGWLKAKGAEIYTLGNFNDCFVATRTCFLSELEFEVWVMTGADPNSIIAYTQYVPGAINIMRFFGLSYAFGHNAYWKSQEGLSMLTALVGRQVNKAS